MKRIAWPTVILSLMAALLQGGTGRDDSDDDEDGCRELAVSSIRLDVERVDLCGGDDCVTVAGRREADLSAIAKGDIGSLDPIVLLEKLSARRRFALKLVLGPGSVVVANGRERPLFVPHRRVRLRFAGGHPGRLAALSLRFDPEEAIAYCRKRAVLRQRDIAVTTYDTVPMSGPVQVITAKRGATLSLANRFELVVPPGAVRRPTAVSALEIRAPRRLSSIYALEPTRLALLRPATVRLRYRSDAIPSGYPEDQLVILHDGDRIPTTRVADQPVAVGKLKHFSSVWVSLQTAVATEVAPGVEYTDRSMEDPAIHVVTIDRTLVDHELHVLTVPHETEAGVAYLRTTPELASSSGALVAINGYLWDPGLLGDLAGTGSYQSTTIVDSQILAEKPTSSTETMMGFAAQSGTGLLLQKLTQAEYDNGEFPDYRYHLLGSHTSLKTVGECRGEGRDSRWTAIGYSPDKVVMVSSDWGSDRGSFLDTDLCAVFDEFAVTDAVRLDGGGSPAMVVDGVHVNPRGGLVSARRVATAIGLVKLEGESLVVPTNGTEVATARSYGAGERVRIEVKGAIVWGGCDPVTCPDGGACGYTRFGDAQYLTDDCWASSFRGWQGVDISLHVNGSRVDWGAYNSDHVYSIVVDGTNAPIRFRYADCGPCYLDNSGSFNVTVTPVADDGTLFVPTDGTEVTTSQSYPAGQQVRIEASGAVVWGGCDPVTCPGGAACDYTRFGDAQYLTDDCWASVRRGWQGVDISLHVNGSRVDWGPHSSDHVYSVVVGGTGGPLRFRYSDCSPCYVDNAGVLTLKVLPVP